MSDIAIRVENLGKKYRLGLTHAGTIRDTIHGLAGKVLGARRKVLGKPLAPNTSHLTPSPSNTSHLAPSSDSPLNTPVKRHSSGMHALRIDLSGQLTRAGVESSADDVNAKSD